MTLSNPKKTLAQTVAAIQAMDLSMIKFKAMRKEDGYGWSTAYADAMEQAYKRYLILHAKYPEMTLAPEQDIDRFWHMHILDTRKYAADCEATFGRFLHHFPYLGLRGEEDAKALDNAFEKMQALYLKEFGEKMPKASAWCAAEPVAQSKAAWCAVESAKAEAAWCAAEPVAQSKAAWCAVESAKAEAAWCAAEPVAQSKAAWCAVESAKAEAAWCAAEPVAQSKAAWCALDSATQASAAAWCALESTESAPKAAWCAVESKAA